MNVIGAILPHAGKQYAGECRKELFDKIKNNNIEIVIYISALHRLSSNDKNVYILENTDNDLFKDLINSTAEYIKPTKKSKLSKYLTRKITIIN